MAHRLQKTKIPALLCCLLILLTNPSASKNKITYLQGINIQYVDEEHSQVNVIINADKRFDYKTFKLAADKKAGKPSRYVVDAFDARPKFYIDDYFQRIFEKDKIIRLIRVGKNHKDFTRIVFDLKQPVNVQVTEQASRSGGQLFFISFTPINKTIHAPSNRANTNQTKTNQAGVRAGNTNIRLANNIPPPKKPEISNANKVFTIVIDPGHGGRDPGAVSKDGRIKEKNINYSVARKIQRYINQDPSFDAYLTRNSDAQASLSKRLKISHNRAADIFISIHVDSFIGGEEIHGSSVFVLADKSASNQLARLLAAKENEVDSKYNLQGVDEIQNKDMQFIVRDLQRKSIDYASEKLAKSVLSELAKVRELFSPIPRKGPFSVLSSSYAPSILIELGYITNQKEALALVNNKEQEKIAKAVYRGIKNYATNNLDVNPKQTPAKKSLKPTRTKAKVPSSNRRKAKISQSRPSTHKTIVYIVKRHDTFESIARKFNINADLIKEMNPKYRDLIFPGDRLFLPALR